MSLRTRQPYHTRIDDVTTNAVKTALGLPLDDPYESIAKFVDTLLASRGFSDNQHYFRVFAALSELHTDRRTLDSFVSWFDETFPGKGVWREELEQFGQQVSRNAFAMLVKELRENLGLTRTALACRVGVAPSQINRWEDGEGMPRDATLVQLGEVLGHNPARLWALANNVEI